MSSRNEQGKWMSFASLIAALVCTAAVAVQRRRKANMIGDKTSEETPGEDDNPEGPEALLSGYEALIGRTPTVKLRQLSSLLQRSIFVKIESMNPGGTGKDRAALGMIRAAQRRGELPSPVQPSADNNAGRRSASWTQNGSVPPSELSHRQTPSTPSSAQSPSSEYDALIWKAMARSRTGGLVVEGTSGSTGISLATLSASLGHACLVVMPDDQAHEKQRILRTLGAIVVVVKTASYSSPLHYVNVARAVAQRARDHWGILAAFMDQFENPSNYQTHYDSTGPEILKSCPSGIDAFCMSSGTGGTISGVGRYLKDVNPAVKVVLVDPPGSSLYNKVTYGVAFAVQQSEQALKRHRYDTIAEGIGLDRITQNLQRGLDAIDEAIQVTDQEAVDMAHWLLHHEGIWIGSSSAMNVVGAVRTARTLPVDSTVATVVCDSGHRHLTRFWNQEFCTEWGLAWPGDVESEPRIPDCLQSNT